MKDAGLFRGVAENPMVVPKCRSDFCARAQCSPHVPINSRSGDIIEPLLVPQWFCDCKDMAQRAVDAVRNKELKLVPEHHEKVWFNWLENSRYEARH